MAESEDIEENSYQAILGLIFQRRYVLGSSSIEFARVDLAAAATELSLSIGNLGDVVYAVRYRIAMPATIVATQPPGMEWIIEGMGKSKYRFRLQKVNRIVPRADLAVISIPDATPEIIRAYKLDDEQALLAVIRYNRLVDVFLGLTTFSLQNHLRTSVPTVGQIEIDEVYVGIDKFGLHYLIPIQAKGGADQISAVQTRQDLAWCTSRWKDTRVRAVSAQFMSQDRIALFELVLQEDEVRVVEERHYKLVPAGELDQYAINNYRP